MRVEPINVFLGKIDVITPPIETYGSFKLPLGTFLVAFSLACLSESIKLHDKISDLLKIRLEFDLRHILIPMALLSNVTLNQAQFQKIKAERSRLMGEVFYAFASSSAGRSVIDEHTITQALTSWSWYWVLIEANVMILVTSIVMLIFNQYFWTSALLLLFLFFMTLGKLYKYDCVRYVDSEIRQILSDKARKLTVVEVFNAL